MKKNQGNYDLTCDGPKNIVLVSIYFGVSCSQIDDFFALRLKVNTFLIIFAKCSGLWRDPNNSEISIHLEVPVMSLAWVHKYVNSAGLAWTTFPNKIKLRPKHFFFTNIRLETTCRVAANATGISSCYYCKVESVSGSLKQMLKLPKRACSSFPHLCDHFFGYFTKKNTGIICKLFMSTKKLPVFQSNAAATTATVWLARRAITLLFCFDLHRFGCVSKWNHHDAIHLVTSPRVFLKVWRWWPLRHFQRPQLFHLNAEIVVKRGFSLFWWWLCSEVLYSARPFRPPQKTP